MPLITDLHILQTQLSTWHGICACVCHLLHAVSLFCCKPTYLHWHSLTSHCDGVLGIPNQFVLLVAGMHVDCSAALPPTHVNAFNSTR